MTINLDATIAQRAEPAKIWKARSYIQEHLEEELSLTVVAQFVCISPNHLSEKFKEVTGVKFVDYVACRRFVKARLLLQNRALRISEIAFEVGFQSLSQFNRVFKRLSGKSPTEFRATECNGTEALPNGCNCHQSKTSAVQMRSRPMGNAGTARGRATLPLIRRRQ